MTTLKRCMCGKYQRHGGFTKPDKIQLGFISIGLAKKEIQIENVMCDDCKEAYAGFNPEKVSEG